MNESVNHEHVMQENLKLLTADFRTPAAVRGVGNLHRDIKLPEKKLNRVLRDYRVEGIDDIGEIMYRDEVDELLQYYSLLELGILFGIISRSLTPALREEIAEILGNRSVKSYYEKFYPLFLPQLLHMQLNMRGGLFTVDHEDNEALFNQVLLLESMLDDDVNTFLWFLDGGSIDDYNIDDLNQLIRDKKRIDKFLDKYANRPESAETSSLEDAFWGFMKFGPYMLRYEDMMRSCSDDVARSALWHYQAYWFTSMKDKMEGDYLQGLRDINAVANDITAEEFAAANPHIESNELTEHHAKWRAQNDVETERLINAVTYLVDHQHGRPLRARAAEAVVQNPGRVEVDPIIKIKIRRRSSKSLPKRVAAKGIRSPRKKKPTAAAQAKVSGAKAASRPASKSKTKAVAKKTRGVAKKKGLKKSRTVKRTRKAKNSSRGKR